MRRHVPLLNLTPIQQLRAPHLARRLIQLFVGLAIYGFAMAMLVRPLLGLDPWDVFHYGATLHIPLSFGQVTIVTGLAVLVFWIPLRQWPGLGTIANAIVIGLVADWGLAVLDAPTTLLGRWAMFLGGVVLTGLAGGLYIGSQFGPGPRDGLMTGLAQRTGLSIRLVRTVLELTVLVIGWLLGGPVGLGTIVFALGIGPLVQFFLPRLTVDIRTSASATATAESDEQVRVQQGD